MKKFFSLVLALVMALSLTTVAWGADTTLVELQTAVTNGDDITVTGTVEVTATLNVTKSMTITGGTFKRAADFAHLFKVTGTDVVLTLDGVTIDGNGANYTAAGSAIWVSGGASVVVKNSTITNHYTTYYPAAIFAPDSSWDPVPAKDVKLINTVVSENETTGIMGAVTVNDLSGSFVFDAASKVLNNTAVEAGGIEIHKSEASIAGLIQGNEATAADGNGAGLYVLLGTDETVTIESTAVITGNTAGGAGGGVYVNGEKDSTARGKVVMNGGTISGNTAKDVDLTDDDLKDMGGDDVYVARGNMEINGGTVGGEILVSKANASYAGGELTINGGTFSGEIITPATAAYSDVAISGGTFSVAPTDVATGYTAMLTTAGTYAVVPTSTAVDKFDLYKADSTLNAALAAGAETVPALTFTDKAAVANSDGSGNLAYIAADNGEFYVKTTNPTAADYAVTVAGKTAVLYYVSVVDVADVTYAATAKAFTNFGIKCGQLYQVDKTLTYYEVVKADAATTWLAGDVLVEVDPDTFANSMTNVLVGNKVVVVASAKVAESKILAVDKLVAHNWAVTGVTYSASLGNVPTEAKCLNCGAVVTDFYYGATKVPAGKLGVALPAPYAAWYIVEPAAAATGGSPVVVTPSKPVQSADTFDAGIAMYVGMSVMAAAGGAVVIGKKKD